MKRLYIAAVLLAVVAGMCLLTHTTHRRRIDGAMATLDRIESLYRAGDTDAALREAEAFVSAYQRISDRISLYVAHGELREARETAALLPTLLQTGSEEELMMELTRLRAQLLYLRQVDAPLWHNIL